MKMIRLITVTILICLLITSANAANPFDKQGLPRDDTVPPSSNTVERALYLSDVPIGSVSGESGTMYVLIADDNRADRLESVVYKVLGNKLEKVLDTAEVSVVAGIAFDEDSKFLAVTHDEGTNKTYVIAQLKLTADEYYLTATDVTNVNHTIISSSKQTAQGELWDIGSLDIANPITNEIIHAGVSAFRFKEAVGEIKTDIINATAGYDRYEHTVDNSFTLYEVDFLSNCGAKLKKICAFKEESVNYDSQNSAYCPVLTGDSESIIMVDRGDHNRTVILTAGN